MPDPTPKPNSLTRRLGHVVGILGGLLGIFVIGPALFPRVPGQFNFGSVLTAGICGGLGAFIGSLIGALIERREK